MQHSIKYLFKGLYLTLSHQYAVLLASGMQIRLPSV